MKIINKRLFFCYLLLFEMLGLTQGFSQTNASNPQPVIFDGYKGVTWGTKFDDFVASKGCGNKSSDCVYNLDKKDITSFKNLDVGDATLYEKLMALGISMRDDALFSYMGDNCTLNLNDPVDYQSKQVVLPDVFDSVLMKSENVVYFFVNKEFAGAYAIIDANDVDAANKLMKTKLDSVPKPTEFNIVPIRPVMQQVIFEIKHSKKPTFFSTHIRTQVLELMDGVPAKFDYVGTVFGDEYPFNVATVGCVVTIQRGSKKYGELPHDMPLPGEPQKGYFVKFDPHIGGLAYWNPPRLQKVVDSLTKKITDESNAAKAKEQEKKNQHYDKLLKTNPNFQ